LRRHPHACQVLCTLAEYLPKGVKMRMRTNVGPGNATTRIAVRESTLDAVSDFANGLRATNDTAIQYLIKLALRLAQQEYPLLAGQKLKSDFEEYVRETQVKRKGDG